MMLRYTTGSNYS